MSYTERATTRTQCRKLTKFIRTAEYLFMDAISTLSRSSAENFLADLERFQAEMARIRTLEEEDNEEEEDEALGRGGGFGMGLGSNSRSPIFIVAANVSQDLVEDYKQGRDAFMDFVPLGKDVRKYIEECVRESLRAICACPSFLTMEEFEPFTAPLAELGEDHKSAAASGAITDGGAAKSGGGKVSNAAPGSKDLFELVAEDRNLLELLKKIGEKIDGLFEEVVSHSGMYIQLLKHYCNNEQKSTDWETYSIEQWEEHSVNDFEEWLTDLKNQQTEIAKLGGAKDLGVFRLDLSKFRDILDPSPKKALALLQYSIPLIAAKKTEELFARLKDYEQKLHFKPSAVEEYVQFTEYFKDITDNQAAVDQIYGEIIEIINVFKKSGFSIDRATNTATQDLTNLRDAIIRDVEEIFWIKIG